MLFNKLKEVYFAFVEWLCYPTSGQLQRMLYEEYIDNLGMVIKVSDNNSGVDGMKLKDKLFIGALIADNLEKIILDLEKTIKNEMPEFCKNNIHSISCDHDDGSLVISCMVKNNLVKDVYECLDKWLPDIWLITDEGDYYSDINTYINLNTIKYLDEVVN